MGAMVMGLREGDVMGIVIGENPNVLAMGIRL